MSQQSPSPNVLLVTGGSRGIGAATCLLGARAGYSVCVNYHRNRDSAEAVAASIRQAGGRAMAVAADVGVESDVLRLFETVDGAWGPLSALVNNAGILGRQCRVEDLDADRMQRIFATNVIGSLLCAREAVRRMSTRRGGRGGTIVNVSSVAARLGSAGEYVDYAASKGAVDTLTVGLAKEVAAEGIRVNGVRPGYVYTDIHASGGEANRVQRLESRVPMGRGGQPDDIARAILWLLSESSGYCSGSILDVAGGL